MSILLAARDRNQHSVNMIGQHLAVWELVEAEGFAADKRSIKRRRESRITLCKVWMKSTAIARVAIILGKPHHPV